MQYLEEWEAAVQSREDVMAAQKKSMLLSTETLTGHKLTSKTIVIYLHVHKYTFLLQSRTCSNTAKDTRRSPLPDPLEKFLGLGDR